jgi:hypothetical protein
VADASFNTTLDDPKSQSGYTFILNGRTMSWRRSNQSVLADLQWRRNTWLLRKRQMKGFE